MSVRVRVCVFVRAHVGDDSYMYAEPNPRPKYPRPLHHHVQCKGVCASVSVCVCVYICMSARVQELLFLFHLFTCLHMHIDGSPRPKHPDLCKLHGIRSDVCVCVCVHMGGDFYMYAEPSQRPKCPCPLLHQVQCKGVCASVCVCVCLYMCVSAFVQELHLVRRYRRQDPLHCVRHP